MDSTQLIFPSYVENGLRWIIDVGIPQMGVDVVLLEVSTRAQSTPKIPNPECWLSTDQSIASTLIRNIIAQGVSVVAPMGNSDNNGDAARTCNFNQYAAPNGVIAVGASVDPTSSVGGWSMASFSGRGPTADFVMKPSIVAPGSEVMAAQAGTNNNYFSHTGTSPAAPFVVGVVAGLLDAGVSTPTDILTDIQSTGKRVGGYNSIFGGGYIQPLEAYKKAIPSSSTWDLTRNIATYPLWCGVLGESLTIPFTVADPSIPVVMAPVSYNFTYNYILQGGFGALYTYQVLNSSGTVIWAQSDAPTFPQPSQSRIVGPLVAGTYSAVVTQTSFLGTLPPEGFCILSSVSYK